MCIVFIYVNSNDVHSDYKLILISNRDESYDRPAQKLGPWIEDDNVYGGRDLQPGCEGGTWLAVSASHRKIGLLLNLPGTSKPDVKSRGKIVENYIKSDLKTTEYIDSMKEYFQGCNEFVFVSIELSDLIPIINTYNNRNNELKSWYNQYLDFSNSLPNKPLKKVIFGKNKLEDVSRKFNKVSDKEKLIEELITILKSEESNLPDAQLEQRQPQHFKELSSVFVKIPSKRYGTRIHTIILLTKTGEMDIIELSMQTQVDPVAPSWERTEFKLKI
ncbi:transport and Golgi organization protein 2 [Battus philenor]|uniref:transport and Golgi organization protein 2 n=1 Tax=Battus philenor TaxID=42288 RepID=UPI0035CF34AA